MELNLLVETAKVKSANIILHATALLALSGALLHKANIFLQLVNLGPNLKNANISSYTVCACKVYIYS